MKKYTILRDLRSTITEIPRGGVESAIRSRRSRLRDFADRFRRDDELPQIKVEAEELSVKDARNLARDPSVLDFAESMPTRLIKPVKADHQDIGNQPNDPTWGVDAVGAPASNFTGSGVSVAVLDTGIDEDHPAFSGVDIKQEDFSGSGNGDLDGHGTHCAGTIFGRDVGGTRIGVAPGVEQAFIGKVLGDDGRGSSEMLFNGMHWAAQNRARVISMSLGFDFPAVVERLINNGWPADIAASRGLVAYRDNLRVFDNLMGMIKSLTSFTGGSLVVAATGNESKRNIDPDFEVSASLPSAAIDVISVAALGQSGSGLEVAPFSNTDPVISGPGVDIVSARTGGGLTVMSGTSMACPHVAGVTALWWEAAQTLPIPATPGNVRARLLASASTTDISADQDIEDYGNGLALAPNAAMF